MPLPLQIGRGEWPAPDLFPCIRRSRRNSVWVALKPCRGSVGTLPWWRWKPTTVVLETYRSAIRTPPERPSAEALCRKEIKKYWLFRAQSLTFVLTNTDRYGTPCAVPC